MPLRAGLVAFLVVVCAPDLAVGAQSAGYDFPPVQRRDMVAGLHVQVADEADAPGFARVRLTVTVQGPPTLEVAAPVLGDATAAWKIQRLSAWSRDEPGVVWAETLILRQDKPGLVPLPALKIRFRDSAGAEWQDVEWPNILNEVRTPEFPVSTSPPASSWTWKHWSIFVLSGLALFGGVLFWRRALRPPRRSLSLQERTLRELDSLEGCLNSSAQDLRLYTGELSALLRRFLAERFGLAASQQTTAEFLQNMKDTTISDDQRERLRVFLERCDLIKFAGVAPTLKESHEMTDFVRGVVH